MNKTNYNNYIGEITIHTHNKDNINLEKFPTIVNICAQNKEVVNNIFDLIETNPDKLSDDLLDLTLDVNTDTDICRGSIIIKKSKNKQEDFVFHRQCSLINCKTARPVWFLFGGLGGQWPAMAKALMPIKIFANKVDECHQIMSEFGLDLKHILLTEDINSMSTMANKFSAIIAIEIALFEVMKALDIIPDVVIGHSVGEITCAYADGCLTTREALGAAYFSGASTDDNNMVPMGLMVAVQMSWDKMAEICDPGVRVVCNNGPNMVTISGLHGKVTQMMDKLKKQNIVVSVVDSSEVPLHTPLIFGCIEKMTESVAKHILAPKPRSQKWISTSVLENEPAEKLKYASAEYFVNNLSKPVLFYNVLKDLPDNAIVVEISPHALFEKTVTRSKRSVSYIHLLRKDSNYKNFDKLFASMARLYEMGLNPAIDRLYNNI